MKNYAVFFIVFVLLFPSCTREKTTAYPAFLDMDSLVQYVYPESDVEIDTIFSGETRDDLFVYGSDTIAIRNLFLPMFTEPEEKDKEILKIIADTPYLYYKNKCWQLPYEWKSARLQLDFLLFIKTKNKKYLAAILHHPFAMGSFSRHNNVGLADLENEGCFYSLPEYITSPLYIKNYNNDDRLDFLSLDYMRNDTGVNTHFRVAVCSFVEGFQSIEPIKNAKGQPLGFDFIDSAGKYYISQIRK